MSGPNYVSESFWGVDTFLTLLTLLFMFAAMCIPAIIAHRNNDKKQMRISLVCGLTGMFLLIPWIVSVVQVTKKYKMPEKKSGAVAPLLYTLCGIILMEIGAGILYRNYTIWSTTGGIGLVLYGVGLLVVSLLKGKGYWSGLMVMAPMLVSGVRLEYTETLYRGYEIAAAVSVLLVIYNAARTAFSAPAPQQATEKTRSRWAEQASLGVKEARTKVTQKAAQFREQKEAERRDTANAQQPDPVSQPTAEVAAEEAPADAAAVPPAQPASQPPAPSADEVKPAPADKTTEAVPQKKNQPVVGWLVCIKGVYRGESFMLKAGRNFVGRRADMDVCLREDSSIADAGQAAIIYEPRNRQFILMPGDVRELCYINSEVILSGTPIKAYDVLDIGDTSLMLIPCCGEKFSWEDGQGK